MLSISSPVLNSLWSVGLLTCDEKTWDDQIDKKVRCSSFYPQCTRDIRVGLIGAAFIKQQVSFARECHQIPLPIHLCCLRIRTRRFGDDINASCIVGP